MNDMRDPKTILDVVDRERLVSELRRSMITTLKTRLVRARADVGDALVIDSDFFLSVCDELARNTAQSLAQFDIPDPPELVDLQRELREIAKTAQDRDTKDQVLIAELRRQLDARDRQIADLIQGRNALELRLRNAEESASEPLTS